MSEIENIAEAIRGILKKEKFPPATQPGEPFGFYNTDKMYIIGARSPLAEPPQQRKAPRIPDMTGAELEGRKQ